MKEKTNENEINNFEEFINEFQTITKEDFILSNQSEVQKLPKMSFKKLPTKERKKSIDITESKSIKKIITKKINQFFIDIEPNEDEKDNIEQLKDFRTDCILNDKDNQTYKGKLLIDQSYTLCFSGELNNRPLYFKSDYYIFPLLSISQCINNYNYFGQSNYCKEITLKDCRNFIFKFTPNSFKEFSDIIEKYAFPKKIKHFFNCSISHKKTKKNNKNIKIYKILDEFKRQGINFESNKEFRIFQNKNFEFCATYPKKLVVPYNMSDDQLRHCAEFRTKNRIPTLTYRYSKNNCCIWRSSQTKSGLSNYKNESDIELLTLISNNKKLYIYDARPYLNAMANKFKGAGYENINSYPNINIELIFCGIPNIHAVRTAYQKLLNNVSYITNINETLLNNISNSYWYEYIITLIKSSFQICETIKLKNSNVLIHCSDGWDRTSQLCALTQILLDKYYRTLDGFICLIEKDWISFGHQFRYRNGFYNNNEDNIHNDNEFSPIFLQWLDAVYQLMVQNYDKFEFNFNLIIFLAEELFSGKYGTFMFNNDKERELLEEEKTYSIWNYIKENQNKFINKIYDKSINKSLIINYKKIKLWEDYFYRYEKGKSEEFFFNLCDKKLTAFEMKQNKDENIIEKMAKFIGNICKEEDVEKLDNECKKIVMKLKEKEKKQV